MGKVSIVFNVSLLVLLELSVTVILVSILVCPSFVFMLMNENPLLSVLFSCSFVVLIISVVVPIISVSPSSY